MDVVCTLQVDLGVFTAKRFRPKAQGCFNPGAMELASPTATRLCPTIMVARPGRNPFGVEGMVGRFPGLKQPWAL